MDFRDDGHTMFATEEPIVDLIKDLRDEAFLLVRQEVELAKTEMSEKISTYLRNVVYLAAGAIVAFVGALGVLAGLCYLWYQGLMAMGVSSGIAMWLSPLSIGAIVLIVGSIFLSKGISTLRHSSLVPERTVNTIKEDSKWLRERK